MAYSLLVTYDQRVTAVEQKVKHYKKQITHAELFNEEYISKIYKAWDIMRKTKGGVG